MVPLQVYSSIIVMQNVCEMCHVHKNTPIIHLLSRFSWDWTSFPQLSPSSGCHGVKGRGWPYFLQQPNKGNEVIASSWHRSCAVLLKMSTAVSGFEPEPCANWTRNPGLNSAKAFEPHAVCQVSGRQRKVCIYVWSIALLSPWRWC